MAKISTRQLCLFLAAVAPVGKLVLMPNQLVAQAKNDLLFPAAVNFLLQAGVIFALLLLAGYNRSFYELLNDTFGKIAAKIIATVFALFLFYAALVPLLEQRLFVQSVFYDTLPSLLAFSPFYLFSAYLCAKPLVSFGRTWDILAPVAIVGFAGVLIFAVGGADFGALAPVGAGGAGGFLRGTAYTLSWFYDSAIVLVLLGKIDCRKGTAWKGAVSYLAGAAATLFFLAVFYGIYSDIAVGELFAYARISQYFPGITVLGRIDYLFIFSLAFVAAFYCALPLQAGADCLKQAYGENKISAPLIAVAVNVVMFVIARLVTFRFDLLNKTVTQTLFWIFPAFCILVPLLALALRRRPREKIS